MALLDVKLNRVRAVGDPGAGSRTRSYGRPIEESLSRQLDKEVIATYLVEPEILGGAIIRVGDRVLDGSVRRRMTKLRRQLIR